jgi:hypothetical protein
MSEWESMGSDTIDPSEWSLVSVRRLALYIEASLRRGTDWAMFEHNHAALRCRFRAAHARRVRDRPHSAEHRGAAGQRRSGMAGPGFPGISGMPWHTRVAKILIPQAEARHHQ